jgi:hypothetical protein
MPTAKIKPADLRDAFKADLASCWQYARSLHPNETPYAFALHGLEGIPHLYPYVLTEEGLTKVANRYVTEGYHETVAQARKELRYSMEDSPYAAELEAKLPTVDALVEPFEDTLDETDGYTLLAKAAMEAFAALDKAGTFGKGKHRDSLLLMIETSLAEKDWSLPSVKRLNSRTAARRYEKETRVEGDYVGASSLCISANGRALCYKIYREVDPRTDKIFDDLVVCDVAGLRLKRRWCISMRASDVFPDVTCAPDGTVFVSTRTGDDPDYKTTLTRYANGDKSRKSQATFAGELSSLVGSIDGSTAAILIDGKVHFLDETLQTIASHRAPEDLVLEKFLKSGEVLATRRRGIVTLNSARKWTSLPYRDPVRWLSLNSDETLCAISIIKPGLPHEQKPRHQYGFKLLTFPKMKLLRSFEIPSHQLAQAVLSPDGKLLAAHASECGKRNSFVVIFDVKTGGEVARRKVDYSKNDEFAFLPGSRVLVMTTSGHMKSDPILLWKIRTVSEKTR